MNDLTRYFKLQNDVERLNVENELLRKKLKTSQSLSSKLKRKWDKLYEEYNPPIVTRSDKAMILIIQKHNGELDITLKQIAKQCFVSYDHCRSLSSKHLRSLK